jgi:hypothetical protein
MPTLRYQGATNTTIQDLPSFVAGSAKAQHVFVPVSQTTHTQPQTQSQTAERELVIGMKSENVMLADGRKTDTRSQIPCTYFQRGKCKKGHSCPYLHDGERVVVGGDVGREMGVDILSDPEVPIMLLDQDG